MDEFIRVGNHCKYGDGIYFRGRIAVWDNSIVNKTKLVQMIERLMEREGIADVAELSRLSGMNQPTLHRIMSGEIRESKSSTLQPLASFFRVSMGQLRGEEFYAEPNPDVRLSAKAIRLARRWDALSPRQQEVVTNLVDVLEECAIDKKSLEKTRT